MMKLLIGGSPCTHWSIAQTKNRETEPSGIGWGLFKNYLIALEKYKPDFFLYENNKSMSAAIRAQITRELGVEPIEINSALVSAQSRKRLYWTNILGVGQPEDKGILLRDILESGVVWREKAYTLRASAGTKQGQSKEELERAVRELFNAEKCQSSPWRWLPTGAVIATAELVEVWHIIGIHRIPGKINGVQTGADAEGGPYLLAVLESMSRRGKSKGIMYFSHLGVSEKEIALGDWTPGRYAWELANVKILPEPIQAKGKQGIWNFELQKEDTQK